jgi:flagellar basal-body rod protein FlgF
VAVAGDSWMAVQAKDGTEAYTRRGDLKVAPRACWKPATVSR